MVMGFRGRLLPAACLQSFNLIADIRGHYPNRHIDCRGTPCGYPMLSAIYKNGQKQSLPLHTFSRLSQIPHSEFHIPNSVLPTPYSFLVCSLRLWDSDFWCFVPCGQAQDPPLHAFGHWGSVALASVALISPYSLLLTTYCPYIRQHLPGMRQGFGGNLFSAQHPGKFLHPVLLIQLKKNGFRPAVSDLF